ncbi:MAG: protein dehydratase, partial [Rhodospirillaceae bacterium]|nr:protein dehydratase [Rhodospirillaceae bacterium]
MTDANPYRAWIGRKQVAHDIVTAAAAARMAATLDRDEPVPAAGDDLPPGWHWIYCLDTVPLRATGPDGHAARGAFLP